MGRRITSDNNQNFLLIHHPILYFSFLAATLAATIVIIAALCGVKSRNKPSSSPNHHHHLHTTKNELDSESPHITELENQSDEMQSNELPLPPAMLPQKSTRECRSSIDMKKSSSERRSSFSLSFKKVPRSLTMAKSGDSKAEESVWMKTIILGEKCVPDEEENSVIYEGKGKTISAYHPRNSSSFSISKQLSSIDLGVLPHDDDDDEDTQEQQTNQHHV